MQWSDKPLCTSTILLMVLRNICVDSTRMSIMSQGKIVQVIGAVVDVEFPRDAIPHVYDALKLDENGLTLEVQHNFFIGQGWMHQEHQAGVAQLDSVFQSLFRTPRHRRSYLRLSLPAKATGGCTHGAPRQQSAQTVSLAS